MSHESPASSSTQLSSVKSALRILGSFSVEEPEKRVSDLAAELGMGKSTVSRLLSTLASDGFVAKDPESQKYRLGLRILTLNSVVISNLEINKEARPHLKKLVEETSEAAHVAVLEDDHVVYVEQIECQHPVRILSYVGRRNPIHATSSGKVLLAYAGEDKIHEILNGELEAFTSKTITSSEQLQEQLAAIRKQEYCISKNEYLDGVISIAAPIRDYHGHVAAAVSLVGPSQRMKEQHLASYRNKVMKTAMEISNNLGYKWRM